MIGFEREDDEIIRYYERVKPHDMFNIWGTELMLRLPLKKAERFMSADHGWTPETWERSFLKKDHESVLAEIEDYFQFALEKSITHRGLSASRSVHHYLAWAWLINDMEIFAFLMEPKNYPNYGAPLLLAVAQQYELMDQLPDNPIDREVFMRMAQGKVCSSYCHGGCGVGSPGLLRPISFIESPRKIILPN